MSEKLRPLLDLRVSVTGGVHFDLVKRVLRDIQRAGQEPEEIIHQISETVHLYPCLYIFLIYKYIHELHAMIFSLEMNYSSFIVSLCTGISNVQSFY